MIPTISLILSPQSDISCELRPLIPSHSSVTRLTIASHPIGLKREGGRGLYPNWRSRWWLTVAFQLPMRAPMSGNGDPTMADLDFEPSTASSSDRQGSWQRRFNIGLQQHIYATATCLAREFQIELTWPWCICKETAESRRCQRTLATRTNIEDKHGYKYVGQCCA